MSKPLEAAWRLLDAELLAAEAILAEEQRWVAYDVFEGLGRLATEPPEVVIVTELL